MTVLVLQPGANYAHLATDATSIPGLVAELGSRIFGSVPRVGDVFSGGGSIPFEAARLGCDVYGADLNPVAALLTWGGLNVIGQQHLAIEKVKSAQNRVFSAVQTQIDSWELSEMRRGG